MQLLKDVCSLDQILKFVIITNCKNIGTWNILEKFKVKNCPQSPMLYPFMNKYQFNQLTNTSTPSLSFNLFSCFVVSCRKGNVKTPKSLWPDTLGMTLYLKGASLQKTMMIVPFEKKKNDRSAPIINLTYGFQIMLKVKSKIMLMLSQILISK